MMAKEIRDDHESFETSSILDNFINYKEFKTLESLIENLSNNIVKTFKNFINNFEENTKGFIEVEKFYIRDNDLITYYKRFENDVEKKRRLKEEEAQTLSKLKREQKLEEEEKIKLRKRCQFYLNLRDQFKNLSDEELNEIMKE